MSFPGSIYAPPGVYTQTNFEDPLAGLAANVRVPLILGTGSEILVQDALTVVRGSSSSVDQKIVQEDEAGRAVVDISEAGFVTLGAFDGNLKRLQVKNFPIVTGAGAGTTATKPSAVSVTINGDPIVVLDLDGAKGILTLSTAPELSDEVRVTYFFNRTDTLITDTLSDQISPDAPVIYGSVGQNFVITAGVDDTLSFTVDSEDTVDVTISASTTLGWTTAQIASFINSAALVASSSLSASAATDNFGNTVLMLTADSDIVVGSGTANTKLGLTAGTDTARNKVFYVFQRPIVDGSNAGDATNVVSDVTVEVDNVQVIPTAVDGLSGAVTLPVAPAVGSVVTCKYYFNSWQNTFDYLAHRNIIAVQSCGYTANTPDFVPGVDFVLKDDKILWGAATLIESATHTVGAEYLDDTQITATLVDTRSYMTPCSAFGTTQTQFTLPLQATTGNGKNNPLGAATFDKVSNSRRDWPTDRPDLIFAYWGYSVEDALDRGRVEVTKVDAANNRITLRNAVPVGASVYATFYYNTLVDKVYEVACNTAGGSGSGTYLVADEDGNSILTPTFGSKSAALATVTINFPSGSENLPDCRFESLPSGYSNASFLGPVEEDVTVEFASQDATLAKYTVPSSGPYYIVSGGSDHFDIEVDGAALTPGFVDLAQPNAGEAIGVEASLFGDEVEYTAASGMTTYAITSANSGLDVLIDGVEISAQAAANATGDVSDYVTALNAATLGFHGTASAGGVGSATFPVGADFSDVTDYYVGWEFRCWNGTGAGATVRTVTAYDGAGVLTLDGGTFDVTSEFHLYNPLAIPVLKSRPMTGAFDIAGGAFDGLDIRYVDNGGSTTYSVTLAANTYATMTLLAAQVQTQLDAATPLQTDPLFRVSANSEDQLVIGLIPSPDESTGGYMEFVNTGGGTAAEFARLVGWDVGAASSGQTKLMNCAVARRFTVTGAAPAGNLVYDRIQLRNRIIPGQAGDSTGAYALSQCSLIVKAGTGLSNCGLTAGDEGEAGIDGAMTPATIATSLLKDGVDAATAEPYVTLYQSGGTETQNNLFSFSVDGSVVSMEFTDAAGAAIAPGSSADVPLGPKGTANTILEQIEAAILALDGTPLAASTVIQEGVGFRLQGASVETTASVVIKEGNANAWMKNFSQGTTGYRSEVSPARLASALQANEASVSAATLTWGAGSTAGYFPAEAVASVQKDSVGSPYLYFQSAGTAGLGALSSVIMADAATDSVTRPGAGLGLVAGDGNTGESAIDGFFVTSTDAINGSGSVDNSLLNSGSGQDGEVGQTYRDLVTGLTFSILPRVGGYPVGSTFTFNVRDIVTCDTNVPVNTIPGVALSVANTVDVAVGDSANVTTHLPASLTTEPEVGSYYSVTYTYNKSDFDTQVFTKLSLVEAAYGTKSLLNPVSLAGYLSFLNGAVVVAIKQVQKDTDANNDSVLDSASEAAYIAAIDDVEGPMPGGAYPDMLVPLKSDSLTLFQYLARHCDIQSSIRYRAERTAICGLAAGTSGAEAGETAEAIERTRLRLVYPDIYTLTLTTFDGVSESSLVDGGYMAAAVAGNRARPSIDVATPWTGGRVVGFDKVSRELDAVQQNQVAVRGVTMINQKLSVISIRQGLTTDMSNVLTKTPTVITIADEVQRQARSTLDRYIGQKFLSGMTNQIETQLSATLKGLSDANIIAAFTGVSAGVSEDDPTVCEVEAFYQPVFPLLYIVCTFNVRSSL